MVFAFCGFSYRFGGCVGLFCQLWGRMIVLTTLNGDMQKIDECVHTNIFIAGSLLLHYKYIFMEYRLLFGKTDKVTSREY